jgi:DNA mismatch endonuclease (patch repair protein)
MKGNRKVGSKPETQLRSVLHRLGYRFRKNFAINADELRVKPDVVFTKKRLAVFVDGCFWHRCPIHGTEPRVNQGYWGPKLARNVARDQRVNAALTSDGWTVIRIWEHEAVDEAAERIEALLVQGAPRLAK